MLTSLLQVLFIGCVVVAVLALTDWRWALLLVGALGFVTALQWERRTHEKTA